MSMWPKITSLGQERKLKKYSISKKLKKDKKIDEEFEIILNSLTLDDIIALKLEIGHKTSRSLTYCKKIHEQLINIVGVAFYKYLYSVAMTQKEAVKIAGIRKSNICGHIRKYEIREYFEENENREEPEEVDPRIRG